MKIELNHSPASGSHPSWVS